MSLNEIVTWIVVGIVAGWLANAAVGTGEAWLTELSTDELRDLLMLDPEAVVHE